jgi:hypothetical protein
MNLEPAPTAPTPNSLLAPAFSVLMESTTLDAMSKGLSEVFAHKALPLSKWFKVAAGNSSKSTLSLTSQVK